MPIPDLEQSTRESIEGLRSSLEKFEYSVETPFVPGEMERWIEACQSEWTGLRPHLEWLLNQRHPDLYAEIQREDEELTQRVEQMVTEDSGIETAASELERQIRDLRITTAEMEPNEGKLRKHLESFAQEALSLVIRIRKQELAVRTWLIEAFNRDCGTVD